MCETTNDMTGKTALITGGSSGFGFETAKLLAEKGARVVIASRNETKLSNARNKIITSTGNPNVDYRRLDLASFKSVRNFVSETVLYENRIDVLINNVGAVGLPDKLTEDGLHLMMQVNYFGAFLLTYLLLPFLKASSPSRIINVSAASMYIGTIDFDHLNDVGYWSTVNLLANSKLADSLFTVELADRLKGTGVTANSFDPFIVSDTEILNNFPGIIQDIGKPLLEIIGRPKESVAKELLYMASEPKLSNVSGRHFKFCGEWWNTWLAGDVKLRRRLWDTSKELVMISPTEDSDVSLSDHRSHRFYW